MHISSKEGMIQCSMLHLEWKSRGEENDRRRLQCLYALRGFDCRG